MLAEKQIIELTKNHADLATPEGKGEIDQYLAVDEWERAFEILILELIDLDIKPQDFDKNLWEQILLDFEIDKVGHDHDILSKFERWAENNGR